MRSQASDENGGTPVESAYAVRLLYHIFVDFAIVRCCPRSLKWDIEHYTDDISRLEREIAETTLVFPHKKYSAVTNTLLSIFNPCFLRISGFHFISSFKVFD